MSRRLIITGIAAVGVLGAVVPSFALSATQQLPVTVSTDTHNGVAVGVGIDGRPGAGVSVTPGGQACAWVSLQVPFCTPAVIDTINQSISVRQLPVTVSHDTSNGVAVGVAVGSQPVVGASITPDGRACVGVSEELPVCTPGGIIGGGSTGAAVQPVPVVVHHDDNGTVVGVRDVGVVISNSGRICPVVSTQDWQCIGGN